jgi:hypothetical protein
MRLLVLVAVLFVSACQGFRPPPPWLSASPAELAVYQAELDARVCASRTAYEAGLEWTDALDICTAHRASM